MQRSFRKGENFRLQQITIVNWNCHRSPVATASLHPYCNVQIQRTRMVPNKQDPELSVVYSKGNLKSEIAKNAKSDKIFPPVQDRAGTAFFKLLKI